nr:uncharacterized protein LOC110568511 [Aotus nancymaae]
MGSSREPRLEAGSSIFRSSCFSCSPGLIFCSKTASPGPQHSLRKGHHHPGRTEGQWSQPRTETSHYRCRHHPAQPVVLHGQQQGTRGLKRARSSSDLAASAAAQASSSAPRQPAQGPSTASGKDTTTLAGQRVSGPSPGLKLPITTAATTQPKPVVLHGQQQGTRGLKRARSPSDLAASAAAQASSSAPRQPPRAPQHTQLQGFPYPPLPPRAPPPKESRPGLQARLGPYLTQLLPLSVMHMLPSHAVAWPKLGGSAKHLEAGPWRPRGRWFL